MIKHGVISKVTLWSNRKCGHLIIRLYINIKKEMLKSAKIYTDIDTSEISKHQLVNTLVRFLMLLTT